MKKVFYVMLVLLLAGKVSMNAQVIVGSLDSPHEGAVLELKSDDKGFLLSRVELQGPKIWSLTGQPANGMMVFHTGNAALDIGVYTWIVDKWVKISGCEETPPATDPCESAPVVTISSTPERTSITEGSQVILGTVSSGGGTLSYQWYKNGIAISGATKASYTISSIVLSDYYSCRITNGCGTGIDHWSKCGAKTDTGWLVFMCYNLGATESPNLFSPAAALHGAKYRFGAKSATVAMSADQSSSAQISGWSSKPMESGSNVNWSTGNNPCPTGWRLPTSDEWSQVIANNAQTVMGSNWTASANNYTTGRRYGDALFLPAAGYRYYLDGALYYRGSAGYYWSSTTRSSTEGYYLHSGVSETKIGSTTRSYAYSIRCVAE